MKLRVKFFFVGASFLIIFFCSVYAFLVFQGRILVARQIQNLTGQKVTLAYFDIKPLLNLEIKGLTIQNVGTVETVFISPSLPRLLLGQVALNKVIINKPRFKYERILLPALSAPQNLSKPQTAQGNAATPAVSSSAPPVNLSNIANFPRQHRINLILKQVNLKDGKIDYIDRTVGKDGIELVIKDLNFNMANLYIPAPDVATNFTLSGLIPWEEGKEEGKIEAGGWINLGRQDINVQVKIRDIDGVYLYPYYSQWVDLEKARIEKAKLDFTSKIHGEKNILIAECHLELSDIVRKSLAEGESDEKAAKITDRVLDIFKALDQGKITLDFTIRTKMTRPEFGFGDIKMAFEEKLEKGAGENAAKNIIFFPANLAKGALKTTADISKVVLDTSFTIGNGVRKAIANIFKSSKKEESGEVR